MTASDNDGIFRRLQQDISDLVPTLLMSDISDGMAEKIDLDAGRRRLLELVEKTGASLADLSVKLSPPPGQKEPRNRGYLHDYVYKGSPRRLAYETAQELAHMLSANASELTNDSVIPRGAKKVVAETALGRIRSAAGEPGINGPKNLDVLGFVKAGRVGFFLDNGETLEMTERPPMLIGVPDAYAVYVDDRSMVPALKPGHLLWVHPTKPARSEDLVIIQLKSGEAFVKELIRKNDKGVFCKQYNPEEEIKYPADATIHLVVGIRTSG